MTRPRLLASTALIGIFSLGLTSGQAMAACDISVPTTGQTVTCTGADTTGISGGANNVTVNINSGASISTSGTGAINLGTGVNLQATNSSSSISSNVTTISGAGGQLFIGSTVSSSGGTAIEYTGSAGTSFFVSNTASISGGGGTAIDFGQSQATYAISSTATTTGNVLAGAGVNDLLRLSGSTGSGTFNVSEIGTKYTGFDTFQKTSASTWTLTGTGNQNWSIQGGMLVGDTTSMSGNLAVASAANVTFDQATAGTYASIISGAGSVTKTGAGDLTLSGTNTYTGGTIINGGSIVVSSDSNLGNVSGSLTLMNGGALKRAGGNPDIARNVIIGTGGGTINSNGSAMVVSGVISGTGALTKYGTGTLTLSGANTYTGGTTVSGGGVLQGNTSSLQGNITISSGAGLTFNQSTNGTYGNVISGSGALTKSGTGTVTFTGTNTYTGGTTVSAGELAGTTSSLQGAITNNAAVNFTQNTAGTYAGVMSGTGQLYKGGGGVVTLTGANTYTGGTTIYNGTLNVSADNNLGATSGTLTLNNGTLQYGAAFSSARNIVTTGAASIDTNSFASTISGVVSGTGSLTKTGSGTLTLTGTNTYVGGTIISGGTISVSSNANLGDAAGNLTFNGGTLQQTSDIVSSRAISLGASGGTLDGGIYSTTLSGVISGTGSFTKTGSGSLSLTAANTYTGGTTVSGGILRGNSTSIQGDVVNNANVTFNQTTTGTYSGVMSGTGTLTKIGSGLLVLTGTNTYSGNTSITEGILRITSNANLGTSTLILDGGSLQYGAGFSMSRNIQLISNGTINTNSFSVVLSGAISGSGSLTKTNTGTLTLSGTNTYTGGTTVSAGTLLGTTSSLQGDVTNNSILSFSQATNGTYAGAISGTGTVNYVGGGTYTITGASSYTGGTTVGNASIVLNADNNLGASGNTLTLNNGFVTYATGFASARDISISSGGGYFNTSTNSSTLSGIISGAGSLTKTGSGTLTLSGTNTYGGYTNINGGAISISSASNLGGGSTLALNGGSLITTGSMGLSKAITLDAGGGTFVSSGGGPLSLNGVISGAGSLTKSGANSLALNGANTYTGGTIITAGVLTVNAENNLGAVSGNLTLDTGTLSYGTGFTTTRTTTLGSGGGTLSVASGQTATMSGVISGTGALTKAGTGLLVLSGTSTYTGATTISSGTVRAFSDSSLGATSASLTLDGGTLEHGAAYASVRNVTLGTSGGTISTAAFNSSISGIISGTGSLTKSGSGTLTLSGINTYTGGTTVSAGVLQGTTSSIQGSVVNNASLYLNQTTNGTYAGIISGTGVLTKIGSGTITLAGANTYTGNTRIQGGTLNVAAENNLGSATNTLLLESGTLQYGASFTSARGIYVGATNGTIDTNGYNAILSGSLSGSAGGVLTKTGTGILALTGTGSFTGDMIVSGGILAGTTSNLLGNVLNNAELAFDQTISGTYAGIVSGTGALTKYGTGTVTLSGANTYSGGTAIYGGTLIGTTASLQGDIANDSILQFNQATNGTYAGTVSGTGALTKYGTGTVTLTGANTYSGGTVVAAGSIVATTSSIQGDILNNANVTLDQSANGAYAGDMSGTGALTKSGTGTVTLTGANTYSGGTTVSAGSLVGTNLTLQGNVLNNANVTFDQATNGTYSGAMSGSGTLIKNGTGNLILSNTNTYSGGTTINAGRLSVNGSITGTTTVGASGTLGGSGSFGSIVNSGRIAPGNSIGTMNVTGNVTFNSGSVYEVEVDASGNSDKLIASGALTINGGTVNVIAASGSYGDATVYNNILQGSSRTGTFDGVVTDLVFLNPTLSYTATSVDLTLDRNDVDFSVVAEDGVQAGVANAVQNLGSSSDLYTAFSGLNIQQAAQALDTLSGEHNAGTTTATSQSISTVRNIVTGRIQTITSGTLRKTNSGTTNVASIAPAAGDEDDTEIKKNFWSQVFGYQGHSTAQGTAPAQNRESGGILFGADADLSADSFVGIFGGYESSEIYTDSQGANSDVATWHAGIYANRNLTPSWRISGNILGSFHDIDTTRHISFTGYSATPKGETSGYTISPGIETGYSFAVNGMTFEPFIGLSITHSYIGKYSEEQGGSSNLDVDYVSQTNPSSTIGMNFEKSFNLRDDTYLGINAHVGWNHTYGELDSTQTMQFASGTLPFDVKGAGLSRNSALIGVGAELDINPMGGKAYLDYTGDISKDTSNHGVTMGLKVPF